ncbi:hypothetical protein H6P81_003662 [Aristolochia fimbriata]|uniref:Vacuolar ATPase assembly integral membrane protein VMA21 homolog n=1 Tax=Aristolochia fimbriata TaxID=158543 RepID=A0AAV7FF30_ARIFI|nr:hypothetical protein H6P81_003662 [Aristolochia fimbriata]
MAAVIQKFFFVSAFMWIAPLAVMYGFNHQLIPGFNNLSPTQQTIWSGLVAVISVNLVIAFYIYMAIKEPSGPEHRPDPAFLAKARAGIQQFGTPKEDDSSPSHSKKE